MTYEDGLQFIKSLKKNYKVPSHFGIKRIEFMQMGYAREGVEELIVYLERHKNSNRPILDVIEEFRYFADDFACGVKDPKKSFAWSVIYDTATEILDELMMEVDSYV